MSQNETRRRRTGSVEETVPQWEVPQMQGKMVSNDEHYRATPPRKPMKEKRSKWVVPLLIIIVMLLLFIAICSAVIVAIYNNGDFDNLIGLVTGKKSLVEEPAVEYIYVTPEPTLVPTPIPTPVPTNTPASTPTPEAEAGEFERVLMQRGSLINKVFIDYGALPTMLSKFSKKYDIEMQLAMLMDIETGKEYRAIRMTHNYYVNEYNSGESVGTLDVGEIGDVIRTLEYIKENRDQMRNYSETVYNSSSGMTIGAYYDGKEYGLVVKFSSADTAGIDISHLDEMIELFKGAQTNLIAGENIVEAPVIVARVTPTPTPTPMPRK